MDGKEGMRMDRKRAQMQDHREGLQGRKLSVEGTIMGQSIAEQSRKSWLMSGWIVEPLSSCLRRSTKSTRDLKLYLKV